ncbi:MAG: type IX secretion system membrane protein PorP/SprF [Bacteroidetes bacterium]|nr:type IX secretion system membrane protein PorP/SprF [Bacteroidota bacterium]
MKFRRLLLLLLLLSLFSITQAQQGYMFSQNMFTHMTVNPAYSAINESICATSISRLQWAGLRDMEGNSIAPETYVASVSIPSSLLNGGLGVNIIQDQLGFFKDISVNLGYAYRVELIEGIIGIGSQIMLTNRNIDFNKFVAIDGNDPVLSSVGGNSSSLLLDLGLGIFYTIPDKYYLGASILNLLETKGRTFAEGSTGEPVLDRTIYLSGGFDMISPNHPEYHFKPSVLVKSNFVSTQISISGLLEYNKKFWGGVTYNMQTADALAFLLGVQYKNLKVGYAYDLPLSSINPAGSHELIIGYCFNIEFDKEKESYRNTRFL